MGMIGTWTASLGQCTLPHPPCWGFVNLFIRRNELAALGASNAPCLSRSLLMPSRPSMLSLFSWGLGLAWFLLLRLIWSSSDQVVDNFGFLLPLEMTLTTKVNTISSPNRFELMSRFSIVRPKKCLLEGQ